MNAGVRQQQAAQPAPVSEPVSLISEQELAEQIAAVKVMGMRLKFAVCVMA